jgi:hypothetical protein
LGSRKVHFLCNEFPRQNELIYLGQAFAIVEQRQQGPAAAVVIAARKKMMETSSASLGSSQIMSDKRFSLFLSFDRQKYGLRQSSEEKAVTHQRSGRRQK